MANYIFSLDEGSGGQPTDESVEAIDDIDAQSLAEMRLLLTNRFTQIIATRNGHQVCHLRRDSLTARVLAVSAGRVDETPPAAKLLTVVSRLVP